MSPLFVAIDLQRIFADADSGWATPGFSRVVEPVKSLVTAFSPRVVFTRFIAPAQPVGSWVPYYQLYPFALQPPDSYVYQLVDEFGDAPTLDRTTFGKWDSELAEQVGPGGRMVLAGVSTDCCVISTALAAVDAGVHVQVVADACAGMDDEHHAKALDIMRLYAPMLEVVSTAEVLEQHDLEVQRR
jgi:nicotinamidase-related amidase